MEISAKPPLKPDVTFDGGDLDCGNGLLLLVFQSAALDDGGGSASGAVQAS
jgi:hypothetical protein